MFADLDRAGSTRDGLTRLVIGERNREWGLHIKQMPLGLVPPIPLN